MNVDRNRSGREARDEVNRNVMADPRINTDPSSLPFDGKRMTYGGFKVLLRF